MDEFVRLSPDRLRRAEERLRNPPPGSLAAARGFGIEIENLRSTPEERLRHLERADDCEKIRGIARRLSE